MHFMYNTLTTHLGDIIKSFLVTISVDNFLHFFGCIIILSEDMYFSIGTLNFVELYSIGISLLIKSKIYKVIVIWLTGPKCYKDFTHF